MDAASRQQASSGVAALAQLPLVSFLSATPTPTCVLALAPLVGALLDAETGAPWTASNGLGLNGDAGRDTGTRGRQDSAAASPAAEDVLDLVKQLNVKTPVNHSDASSSQSGSGSGSGDYFGWTGPTPSSSVAAHTVPSTAARSATRPAYLSSASSTFSAASSTSTATIASFASVTDQSSTITPVDSGQDLSKHTPARAALLRAYLLATAPSDGDSADFSDALHSVFRNEAWHALEANRKPSAARPDPHARHASSSRTVTARSVPSRRHSSRRGTSSPSQGRGRTDSAEEDLLLDSLPAAPGFEPSPKLLHTVTEEEDEPGLPPARDDLYPSASPSEVETDAGPESDAFRFLSHAERQRLVIFLFEFVVSLNVLAGPEAESTPGGSNGGGDDNSGAFSRRGSAEALTEHCTLGELTFTATLIPTPSPASPPDGSAPLGRSSPSGFIILASSAPPPQRPAEPLPVAWPPGTGIGALPRPRAVPLAHDSNASAGPALAPLASPRVYEAPTSETALIGGRPMLVDVTASQPDALLSDADTSWLRSLGEGEMAQRIRTHDWARTTLGPISGWCAELRTIIASVLASPFRECILWGEDMAIVYNDLYIETAGDKHPELLGLPAREGWKEIWDGLDAVARRTLAGETCFFKDHFLAMERLGFVEETCESARRSSRRASIQLTPASTRSYIFLCALPELGRTGSRHPQPLDRVRGPRCSTSPAHVLTD